MGHGKASDAKETLDGVPNVSSKDRAKRYVHPPCPVSPNKACPVLLVADFRFYVEIGGGDAAKTAKYMIGVLDYVDHLYRRQTFGDCGSGFGFVIKKILVHDRYTNIENHYNSDRIWTKSEDLLWSFSSHSEEHNISYADFCLVHLFTAQSFTTNVLGISELGQATKSPTGGLCSGFKKHRRSMNTGWTTFLGGNGKRVVYRQAYLVVAHEFGHAWGSGHEFPNSTRCNPDRGGKYLMFVYSVTGSQPINTMFSPCSIEAIRDVLVYKAQVCFVQSGASTSLCGNYKLEDGEQCDEGPGVEQSCCDSSCHFKSGKVCSDLNKPCCEKCQVANASTPCREATAEPCSVLPYCNGKSSECPAPAAKPDGEPCEKQFRGVCFNQNCTSICEYNNKTTCTCDSVELSCRICCRDSENDTCKVYRVLNDTMDYGNLSDSSPCPMGLCSNGVCTKVTDTSVKRSWSFIEIRSFSHFVVFMKNNIVGTVIVLSLLLWIPASCTVSYIDRKRAKKAKKDLTFITRVFATSDFLIPQNDQNRTKIKRAEGTLERKSAKWTKPA